MKDETTKLKIDCQSKYNKTTRAAIEVNLSTVYAIIQGLQFVIEHRKLFEKDGTECEECFQNISDSQRALGEMIEAITEHHEGHVN